MNDLCKHNLGLLSDGLFNEEKIKDFHLKINDYIMDSVLKVWQYLFQEIAPEILCLSSLVPNLFLNKEVSMKSVVNSLHCLTNGQYFKGIEMFLVPICEGDHYYLCVINIAKNEAYVIDGFNEDQYYKKEKKIFGKSFRHHTFM